MRCIAAGAGRDRTRIRVHHGGRQDWLGGPAVKLNRMEAHFPDEPYAFNIIYSVGATIPVARCAWAKRRGVKIVCHINSMRHKAYAEDFEALNSSARAVLELADHVIFGSRHAKNAAVRYLGPGRCPATIVYNGVDIEAFRPPSPPKGDRPVVLTMGVHYLAYIRQRLVPLLQAMPIVAKRYPRARLLVAGPILDDSDGTDRGPASLAPVLREPPWEGVQFLGAYSQEEAPSICDRADVLVHLKHMDWTPNSVIEAMACGLPVIHPGNGGLPELVGGAGVSLELPEDWDKVHVADPNRIADCIIMAYERRVELGRAARERAVKMFDLREWAEAHRKLFESLLGPAGSHRDDRATSHR